MSVHHRTCTLCEAMCGLAIEVEGGAIRSIRGDPEDPFSRGFLCPKATALADVEADPDRLRFPVRRTPAGWQRVSWKEALDETADRLGAIQASAGRDAVAVYLGNPSVHNWGTVLAGVPLVKALGTKNRYSATSVDQLPHHLAALLMFGHQLLLPIPDVDRTDFFLVLGANPVVSNGSLMTAPGMPLRLKALRRRGGRLVVVDPRRTETAELADVHHFIRPGTDALFLLAMLHTLFAEGRVAPGRLGECTDGLDTLAQLVREFPPERAEGPTGIPAETIRRLARDFSSARSAVAYGRVGLSTQGFGGLCQWLLNVLNLVTGNLDRAGGAMFTRPAFDLLRAALAGRGHYARRRSRVRGLPEFSGEYPVATLAEEILTPGPGRIQGMLTIAGNPVLSTPNGARLDRALASLDFLAAVDFYVNETTRHAHLILPPTSPLQHDHYDVVFHLLAVRNTAKYSPALFAPEPGALHDWQIFNGLSTRLARRGRLGFFRGGARALLLSLATPRRLLDLALRTGPYGRRSGRRLSLQALDAAPHGIDLGPLEPCLPERLFTPDRRIRLAPAELVADLARLRERLLGPAPAVRDGSLQLVGRRHLRSNNSWMHNSLRLVKGRERCTLLMHPEDAAERGLSSGQVVQVESRVGSLALPLEVSEEMMPGTVSIPHGWGHGRPGVQAGVATAHAGVSINDLTDDESVDALTGGAAFSGVPVRVAAALADQPRKPRSAVG
jgi:anaerobic selenocysteine-containing dehydrogenase